MKKLILAITALTLSLSLTGCFRGDKVEVPPASVGKILTKNGYKPETIRPSKFRLPWCWSYCEKLVVLQASDNALLEPIPIYMPKDKLNINVDIRGTFSIASDDATVNYIYDRLEAEEFSEGFFITAKRVYGVYGKQAVRGIVRSQLTKYSIQEIMSNREAIGESIHKELNDKLSKTNTPIYISRFELANVQPPQIIIEAQEAAKTREIDIQKEEAQAQIELVKAERALEVAKADRLVEKEKALAIAEQNRIASKSITPQVLAYKQLETAQKIVEAASKNGNTVFLPMPTGAHDIGSLVDSAVLAKMLGKELK